MKTRFSAGTFVTLLLFACSEDRPTQGEYQEHGVVVPVAQALDQNCATATPVQSTDRSISYVSPQTYSQAGCYKGVVVEVTRFFLGLGSGGSTGAGTGSGPGGAPSVLVAWHDAMPTNATDCAAAWAGGYAFEFSDIGDGSGPAFHTVDVQSATGTWNSSLGLCNVPAFTFANLNTNWTYRFAVSARTSAASSAPTRKVGVSTGQ